jgi:hypothetical protein
VPDLGAFLLGEVGDVREYGGRPQLRGESVAGGVQLAFLVEPGELGFGGSVPVVVDDQVISQARRPVPRGEEFGEALPKAQVACASGSSAALSRSSHHPVTARLRRHSWSSRRNPVPA